ncbi:MAG: DUF2231 domain-containing protein [Pyrinomonadaceae bacterium]
MASKASIAGHPVHPMLVSFPLALWYTSFATDVLFYCCYRNTSLLLISKFMIAAGVIGAVAAAIPGIIDWLSIKNQEVKRIANWHARLNIIALLVFAASLYLRTQAGAPRVGWSLKVPFLLSLLGVVLISISSWLGGSLSFKHGVGVAPQHDSPEEEVAKVRFP